MSKISLKQLLFFTSTLLGLSAHVTAQSNESVHACVISPNQPLTDNLRLKYAHCLGWKNNPQIPLCSGYYQPVVITALSTKEEIKITANKAFLYQDKPSVLSGHVEIQDSERIVSAETARIFRNQRTNKIDKIEFLNDVHYLESDKLVIARKAEINPQDKSGQIYDVIYRLNVNKKRALIPAWGRASLMRRYSNSNYSLTQASYTTCAPQDKAWELRAQNIKIDPKKSEGTAQHVTLRIRNWPIFYFPYLSFPTGKERKSGFLMPIAGYTNTGGFDFAMPYYWNIAPNQDLTFVPHVYTERGVLLGGEYRFLTHRSNGVLSGTFLPKDAVYRSFLNRMKLLYPDLERKSTNRWSFGISEHTQLLPNLHFLLNVHQVSDDYYFQDFSTNLALATQRQLLREADLILNTENWLIKGMLQSYQTLHPLNETPIADQYERLPQIQAKGFYQLPAHLNLDLVGQYDQFAWSSKWWNGAQLGMPHGPRLHFDPSLNMMQRKSWGYINPGLDLVENYYQVDATWGIRSQNFNRFIPRYHVRGGLFFERASNILSQHFTQTLEPTLFYLRVPYQNQSEIPIYDTANMIFNVDQLFRINRFSGFDRIGDANQLSYALTSRWLSEGTERASVTVGQIKYFSQRKVQLCRNLYDRCYASPYEIGQISPFAPFSPIASRGIYYFNQNWRVTGDYVWDPHTSSTNNGDLNLHFQPAPNASFNFGYSYLVNGDITAVKYNRGVDNALHQAIFGVAWPINQRWSTIGAYSHNISKDYSMMSLLGLQYDSCCWALRVIGGRTFKNLDAFYRPQYNNNIYLQILLKGLGSIASSDPRSLLNTYIPGYDDPFRH